MSSTVLHIFFLLVQLDLVFTVVHPFLLLVLRHAQHQPHQPQVQWEWDWQWEREKRGWGWAWVWMSGGIWEGNICGETDTDRKGDGDVACDRWRSGRCGCECDAACCCSCVWMWAWLWLWWNRNLLLLLLLWTVTISRRLLLLLLLERAPRSGPIPPQTQTDVPHGPGPGTAAFTDEDNGVHDDDADSVAETWTVDCLSSFRSCVGAGVGVMGRCCCWMPILLAFVNVGGCCDGV